MMLKEVLVQQTSIVSKLHDTETELLRQSKSQGKDSTHDEARKVVKPFGPKAKLNVCTMMPTPALDGNAVSSFNGSHNDVNLFYEESSFDSPQTGKTQALTNAKDVQKASNRAKLIKYLEHQIKAAPVNV